jgi:Flp pilus assembly protein TadG
MKEASRGFWRDEDGFVLVYVTLVFVTLIGFAILAVEASRYKSHQTQLQKAADAAALAAAAELDRSSDSIERATRAIESIVNVQMKNRSPFGRFGTTGIQINVATDVRFLEDLPASDNNAIVNTTADPTKAHYVEVQITRAAQGTLLDTILPIKVVGGAQASNTAEAAAVAVAGFDSVVCKFTPLYMCNPLEGTGHTIEEWVTNPALKRKMIVLKSNVQPAPGNFNYLQPPVGNPGAAGLNEMIANRTPNTCFRQSGVYTKPGEMTGLRDAFNVRFDIYNADMGKFGPKGNNPGAAAYAPAPSVRKGWKPKGGKGDWCNLEPGTGADGKDETFQPPVNPGQGQALPLDDPKPVAPTIIGNGNWNLNDYWLNNYGTLPPHQFETRWDAYKYEVANHALLAKTHPVTKETSAPQCFKQPAQEGADRRAIYGAIINCQEHQSEMNGAAGPLPVEAFAKFFFLQPVGAPPDDNVYVELVEIINPRNTSNDIVHDIVQLYR